MKESRIVRKYGRKNLFVLPPEWSRDPMIEFEKLWEEIKRNFNQKGGNDGGNEIGLCN